jgi:hypothetical protein
MKLLEIILAVILIALLFYIGNPFTLWMPSMVLISGLVVVAALMFVWGGVIVSENAEDEREESNRSMAGRAAYLSAAAVLTIALVFQGFTHTIDFWIPLTLAVMIIAKIIARWYVEANK